MPRLEEVFTLRPARSVAFEDHEPGDVAFVTNGLRNNGIIGFVKPLPRERVFRFEGLVISAFMEATVQVPPFIARGNGGSGLLVAEPIEKMSIPELAGMAAYINRALSWRFSWSWMVTKDRVKRLPLPESIPKVEFGVARVMPRRSSPTTSEPSRLHFRPFKIEELFTFTPGEYHSTAILSPGDIPLVSCGDEDNGIIGNFKVPNVNRHEYKVTIAFNGRPLTAKFHPYTFAAKDDVAVCSEKWPMKPTTSFFVQMVLNSERWRYSYYRKCYAEKLRKLEILLPATRGEIDEEAIQGLVERNPYWRYIKGEWRVPN